MIGMPIIVNEKRIYNPKKIIVNQIIPIIIKTENNYYNFLFTMNNTMNSEVIYVNTFIDINNDDIKNKFIYKDNIASSNIRTSAYLKIISKMNEDNFYTTNILDIHYDDKSNYYYIIGYRMTSIYYEKLYIYFNKTNYIILMTYLNEIEYNNIDINNEYIFNDKYMKRMKFDKLENIKLGFSCESKSKDNYSIYKSHYFANTGSKNFDFNYSIEYKFNMKLREPLDLNTFYIQFSNYENSFISIIKDVNDDYYWLVLYLDESVISLKVEKRLLDSNTNLINPYFIFENEGK